MGLWFRRSVVVAKCRLDEMSLTRMVEISIRRNAFRRNVVHPHVQYWYAVKEEQRCSLSRDGNMDPRNIGKCPIYKFVHIHFFGSSRKEN